MVCLLALASIAHAETEPVRIGVLAIRGESWAHERFDATAAYLGKKLGRPFEVVPMTLPNSEDIVGRGDVDFALTQPANYALLETRFGLTRIATMRNQTPAGAYTEFGGVVFVRADRPDLQELSDLDGRRLRAVSERAFGGYYMALGLLREHGLEPYRDFDVSFSGFPQDSVVFAVRDGEVDAGTVRTHVLERLAAAGKIELSAFRLLHAVDVAPFPYLTSTPLYPEWAFAVARATDPVLARHVAIALLQMEESDAAAQAARSAGWTVPLDYGRVHELLRTLRVPPYEELGKVTPADVWRAYWPLFVAVLVALSGLVFAMSVVGRVNRRLARSNQELERAVKERNEAEQQLIVSEKMASLGQLAAGVAHELNTPLGYVYSNNTALRRYLDFMWRLLRRYEAHEEVLDEGARKAIAEVKAELDIELVASDVPGLLRENDEGLQRMRDIVRDIRSYSHMESERWVPVDVNEVLTRACDIAVRDFPEEVKLTRTLTEVPSVRGVPGRLEQVMLNLLLNARDALDGEGKISVTTEARGDDVHVIVADDGKGIVAEHLAKVFDPFFTTKEVGQGTGLGLAVAQRIAIAHAGRIEVESEPGTTRFRIVLPAQRGTL